MKTKKFAVVLSGCGVFDGAEIHEAVMTLYAIAKNNCIYDIFAPNIEQYHVINHHTGQPTDEKRNVLVEAARIARGKINDLAQFNPQNYDAIIFPGGFGVAKNLCNFAFNAQNATVDKDVEKAILEMHKLHKPIGGLCISPALLTLVLKNIEITIGQDKQTAEVLERIGAKHINTQNAEVIVDKQNLIFTTPCYMLNATIVDIANGADNIVKEMIKYID